MSRKHTANPKPKSASGKTTRQASPPGPTPSAKTPVPPGVEPLPKR